TMGSMRLTSRSCFEPKMAVNTLSIMMFVLQQQPNGERKGSAEGCRSAGGGGAGERRFDGQRTNAALPCPHPNPLPRGGGGCREAAGESSRLAAHDDARVLGAGHRRIRGHRAERQGEEEIQVHVRSAKRQS